MTTVQSYRIKFESLSICQYKLWNIWIDPKVIYWLTKYYYKISNFSYNSNSILKGLLRICSHEKSEDKGSGRRGVVKQRTDEFQGHRDVLERIQSHQDQSSSDQRACVIYGRLECLFKGALPSGRGLTGNDTEIGSTWDLSILMGCRHRD